MDIINTTEIRKNWSEAIDRAVRKHPVFMTRSRDLLALMSTNHLYSLVKDHDIYINIQRLSNGAYSATIPQFDIYIKENSISEVSDSAVATLYNFCLEYYENLDINMGLADSAPLFPLVLKVLIAHVENKDLKDLLVVRT